MTAPQNYSNHVRLVTHYHLVLFPILLVNFVWTTYRLVTRPGIDAAVSLLLAIGFFLMAFAARAFALRAQDRVIRLEMRLRLNELLPATLQPRINEFTPGQLIALRFASDSELPALAATVLNGAIQDTKIIKKMITNWQADTLRV